MPEVQRGPLAQEFHVLSLLRFAFPSMVMMVFMGLYTIIDTIFVARFVSTDALSAVNIVCPVINVIVGTGTMLATGGSAIIAEQMGSGKIGEARRNFTLIIAAGIAVGLTITVIGLLFLDELILGLGASAILFPYCRDYLWIQLLFAVGNIMQVLYQNLFVTAGRPSLGLALSVLAGLANIAFDYIFIVVFPMGIKGAALGTGIGYLIPALAGTTFFFTNESELHFCRSKMDAAVLVKSCSNGASEMVSQMSAAVTTFLFNAAMMRLLGEDGVAAVTVIIYSQFLLTALYIGFSMGVAPVISYCHGSGDKGRQKKIIHICFCFISAVSVFVFLFSFFGGEIVAGLFAGDNRTVLQLVQKGFAIFSFSFLFSGCNIFASAFFTALSNGRASALISFLRTFGFLSIFLFALPGLLGVTGVWLVVPAAELLTFFVTAGLLFAHRREFSSH